jgi:uncharacterized membrane protein
MTGGDGQRLSLLSVALFLSLALNFFLAGWFIGRQPGFGPPPPPPPFDRFFNEHIRQSLSPDGAKKMEAAFEAMRQHFADHEGQVRSSRQRLIDILNADPFDTAKYIAASKASRIDHDKDREAADEELVQAIAQLTPDDRHKLAEIRRHPGPRSGPHHGFGGFH